MLRLSYVQVCLIVFWEYYYDYVFGSILTYMFSFKADIVHEKNHQSDCDDQIGYKYSKIDEFGQKEDGFDSALASSTSKCQFSSERHISRFIGEPKTLTFTGGEAFDL
ncbi:hypothetical protein QYF36_008129 [Acer negundo]|nr:hypothetical protein QYF36_008129 [Acer negundo]